MILGGACLAVSILLLGVVWTRGRAASSATRAFWSLVVLVPVIGWVFFLCFFNPPSVQPKELQGRFSGRGVGSLLLSIKGKRGGGQDR